MLCCVVAVMSYRLQEAEQLVLDAGGYVIRLGKYSAAQYNIPAGSHG